MVIHGPQKRSENPSFFPSHCFTLFPRFTDVFRHGSCSKRPKGTFYGRSYSSGPNHACIGKGPNQRNTRYVAARKRSALESPTKTVNTDLVPIGDDIKPIEAPRDREMMKMKNHWKQRFPEHRIELLEEEERERTTPIVAFDYGFLTQENAVTFPFLICRYSRYGQRGATCCERKSPTAYSISFLVDFIKDLGFRRITL